MLSGLRLLGVSAAVALVAGCAVIEISRPDGSTQRTFAMLSPINVVRTPVDQARSVRISGVGVLVHDGGGMVGYFRSSELRMDPGCHVVLIDNTDAQLRQFASLIGSERDLCSQDVVKGVP